MPFELGRREWDGNESAECNKHQNTKNYHQKDILKKETLHFQIKTAQAARAAAGTGDWEGFGAAATGKCWNSLEFQVWR